MRYVVDANVLIDLRNGGILFLLFELQLELSAPDVVLDELAEADRNTLLNWGLDRVEMTSVQLLEAQNMNEAEPGLSFSDRAALITARDEAATLLTGDRRLRRHAENAGVAAHGVLWILDELERVGLLEGRSLAESLQRILDGGARLPATECDEHLKRWRGGTTGPISRG